MPYHTTSAPLTKEGQIAALKKQLRLLEADNKALRKRLETQEAIIEGYQEAAGLSVGLTEPEWAPDPQTPGRAIREAREAAGLTLKELAAKIGCSWGTIGGWEQGRRVPRPDYARALNRVLGIDTRRAG